MPHDLGGATVTLWRIEEEDDHYAVWFRLSNLSDRTWECSGIVSDRVRERDNAVCLITEPTAWHQGPDGIWAEWQSPNFCGVRARPSQASLAPGDAAVFFWIQPKDDERSFRVACPILVDGQRCLVSSKAISHDALRHVAGAVERELTR